MSIRRGMTLGLAVASLAVGLAAPGTPATAAPVSNIPYGTNQNGKPLLLDAYPATAPLSPVILVIHGGGWENGDKTDNGATRICEESVLRGYACFSVNYTLSGEAKWPAQLDDLRKALDWIRTNALAYGGQPLRISCWGFSAGAHLCLQLAYTTRGISAAVSWSAPTDLVAWANQGVVKKLLGCATACPERARDASPTVAAHPAAPATYIGHATNDKTVPYWHATSLAAALDVVAVPYTLVTQVSGHGKGLWFRQRDATFAWLSEHV